MTLGPARTLNLLTSARPLLPGEVILTGPTHHRLTRGRCPANILSSYGGSPHPRVASNRARARAAMGFQPCSARPRNALSLPPPSGPWQSLGTLRVRESSRLTLP